MEERTGGRLGDRERAMKSWKTWPVKHSPVAGLTDPQTGVRFFPYRWVVCFSSKGTVQLTPKWMAMEIQTILPLPQTLAIGRRATRHPKPSWPFDG